MNQGLASPETERPGRSVFIQTLLALLAGLFFFGFIALGTWQVQRRAWKLDLIERVEQRVHATPVPAPGPARWASLDAADDSYRHVQISGRFIDAAPTLVQAVTELGGGYWVLAPLQTADGSVVLINRGFVPPERREHASAGLPVGTTTVTGLLRISEPGGGFLRHNQPAARLWYSRDVAAIASAAGLARVAPYFIDQEAAPPAAAEQEPDSSVDPGKVGRVDGPVAGLTVVSFQNNHAVYAVTWYTLALMVAGAAWFVLRTERGPRRR